MCQTDLGTHVREHEGLVAGVEVGKGLQCEDKGQADLLQEVGRGRHRVQGGAHETRVAVALVLTTEVRRGERRCHGRGSRLEGTRAQAPVALYHLQQQIPFGTGWTLINTGSSPVTPRSIFEAD